MNKEIKVLEYEEFPEKLKIIKNSPNKIYAYGNIELLFEDSIAVIGTRKITEYGIICLKKIVKELALRDIIIVSGMASGTDTLAHEIALENEAKTIAVLGGGFDYIYPKENTKLFERIVKENGLIISEYAPNIKYKSEYFPKRNRIISAISEGVLVIEAAYRSGTGITVNYAKKQGKKVFAIPGRIDSKYSVGVNQFLKEGAILTTDACDILDRFPQFNNKKRKTIEENKSYDKFENEKYKKILNALNLNKRCIDEIIYETKIDRKEVLNILFELEIEEMIEEEIGVGYRLKKI